jgi:hypothetical protein
MRHKSVATIGDQRGRRPESKRVQTSTCLTLPRFFGPAIPHQVFLAQCSTDKYLSIKHCYHCFFSTVNGADNTGGELSRGPSSSGFGAQPARADYQFPLSGTGTWLWHQAADRCDPAGSRSSSFRRSRPTRWEPREIRTSRRRGYTHAGGFIPTRIFRGEVLLVPWANGCSITARELRRARGPGQTTLVGLRRIVNSSRRAHIWAGRLTGSD